jgi:hypothetical protein
MVGALHHPPSRQPGRSSSISAKDEELAADDVDGVNSPFARTFVMELKVPSRCGGSSTVSVTTFVDATNKRQQPFTDRSPSGWRNFYFVAKR